MPSRRALAMLLALLAAASPTPLLVSAPAGVGLVLLLGSAVALVGVALRAAAPALAMGTFFAVFAIPQPAAPALHALLAGALLAGAAACYLLPAPARALGRPSAGADERD